MRLAPGVLPAGPAAPVPTSPGEPLVSVAAVAGERPEQGRALPVEGWAGARRPARWGRAPGSREEPAPAAQALPTAEFPYHAIAPEPPPAWALSALTKREEWQREWMAFPGAPVRGQAAEPCPAVRASAEEAPRE